MQNCLFPTMKQRYVPETSPGLTVKLENNEDNKQPFFQFKEKAT